jgi:hypothetical protein
VQSLEFGAAPSAGTISAAGEIDCWTFRAAPGRRIRVRVVETDGTLVANTEVLNANGSNLCGPSTETELTCRLVPGRSKIIVIRDLDGTNTGGYVVSVQMADRALGCLHPRFGHTKTAVISGPGGTDCYRFVAAAGDHLRVRVVPTSGTIEPNTEMLNPNGTTFCGPSTAIEQSCRVNSSGGQTIFIRDLVGTNTGGYSLYVQRLNAPEPCTVIELGGAAVDDAITTPGAATCFTFTAIGNRKVHVDVAETSGTLDAMIEIIKPNGVPLCPPTSEPRLVCLLVPSGDYSILVRDTAGPNTGTFTLSAGYGPGE